MEVEAVETSGILYHLHICTGVVVMVELVEVHTRTLVGSHLPQTHTVLRLSHMDLPLLSHTDLRRLISMVPRRKHMDLPLLSHMDLRRPSPLVLLLKVMGLLVAPTDRRSFPVA
jgi:hypothetical protein